MDVRIYAKRFDLATNCNAVRVYCVEKFSVTNCNQIVKTVLMSNDMRLSELHYLSGLGPWQMLFILISRQLS
jgi:hypothetical protein